MQSSWRAGCALFSALVLVLAACAGDNPAATDGFNTGTNGDPHSCASPNSGCPCDSEGASVACGKVERVSGDYIACSDGKRTCAEGKWGECIGDAVISRTVPASTLQFNGLGASTPCVGNPCDPSCKNFIDTPTGLTDAGAGFAITEAGVQLSGSYGDAGPSCTALSVTPSPSTLTVTDMTASNTKQLTADVTPSTCYAGTVAALWTVDKYDISQVSSTGLVNLITPIAGPIAVNAYVGTLSAVATVNVVVNVFDNSVAPAGYGAQGTWTGALGAADPLEMLYPYDGTMLPLGLLPPTIQWRDGGSAADAAMITLRYPANGSLFKWSQVITEKTNKTVTNGTAVTPSSQPRALIPSSVWFAFEQTVARNRATNGDTATFAVQRYYGSSLHPEKTRTLRFADGQLKGKIYYNSYGTNLVKNSGAAATDLIYNGTDRFGAATLVIPPGASAPSVVAGYNSANGSGCRACHSVSPNGNMLGTLKDSYEAVRYDLTQTPLTETSIGAAGTYAWPAFSPDGSYLFSDASSIFGTTATLSKLYNLNGTAITTGTVFTSLRAGTPQFNANATQLVFNFFGGTASPLANPSSGVTTGDKKTLSMMNFNSTTKTFSTFVNLHAPASGDAVWPSFLPVGQNGVVFEREIIKSRNGGWGITRSNCDLKDGACNKTGATGELWWVNTTGTIQANVLAKANGVSLPTGPALHGSNSDGEYAGNDGNTPANNVTTANFNDAVYNYEPGVLPVQAGGYSWVAFTSRRMYGNIATINPYYSDPRFRDISAQPTTKKIWITAISSSPVAGTDPSFPAFYLPGQELLAGNARAYFALDACKVAGAASSANVCETDLDCCGGTATPKTAVCSLDTPLTSPPVRHCVSVGASTCSADGAACTLDSQCCNFGTGSRCSSFTCQKPPPLITYTSANFEREFVSACGVGSRVKWRFFDWQSITPTGTSISFTAATKNVGGTYGADVSVGYSSPPPQQTATWTSGPQTVDEALKASGQQSLPVLRVTAIFTPTTVQPTATPTLTQWRQSYDCVDSE